jgi:hypothetical protein
MDTSTPKRIGDLSSPLLRKQAQTKARHELEHVKEQIREGVNRARTQAGFTPYTPARFAVRLKPYMAGAELMPRKLQRAYRLLGNCREAERSGFGFSKSFEVEMNNARAPKQMTI